MSRVILHIDMDAFYASVEQLDNPALKGRPVVVGGDHRGVVSAASYEARKFGVHSAMPMFQARKRCPHAVFLPVRMSRYQGVSRQVMAILESFTPLLEQVSIDEAYLDITGTRRLKGPPLEVAREIKKRIKKEVGITCSVGVAPNKFLAKIASDLEKPDGLTVVSPEGVTQFLGKLPVAKIPGIGKKSLEKMKKMGVESVSDLLTLPEDLILKQWGKYGQRLLSLARGVDRDQVVPYHRPKSISSERTFPQDTRDLEILKKWLLVEAEEVGRRLRSQGLKGRTVNLKIKLQDFRTRTRSHTLNHYTDVTGDIYRTGLDLLRTLNLSQPLRLIGLGISSLQESEPQLDLWAQWESSLCKQAKVDRAVDLLKRLYGRDIIRRGSVVDFQK